MGWIGRWGDDMMYDCIQLGITIDDILTKRSEGRFALSTNIQYDMFGEFQQNDWSTQ